MREYIFAIRLCDGHRCDGTILIMAEKEYMAYDMALDYVCSKLYEALPELDIAVTVELVEGE